MRDTERGYRQIDFPPLTEEQKKEIEKLKAMKDEEIDIEDFARMDLRTATVLACEKVPKSNKLLKFRLKVGDEERTVVSGVAKYYEPEDLVGKNLVLIANLRPAKIFGIESQGMLLYAQVGDKLEAVEAPTLKGGAVVK